MYTNTWKDAVTTLLDKRLNKPVLLPGYNGHNYGISIDLDLKETLLGKFKTYKELCLFLEKHNWFCHRRDKEEKAPGLEHFNFLGQYAQGHLVSCTMDPATWPKAAEEVIWETYKEDFNLSPLSIQQLLAKVGIYKPPFTESLDAYTREAILTFQKAWGLTPNGFLDQTFCRVLSFVSADVETI